ncbi:MAG: universal stress protein E [Paraglaciecola sp.]|jgi:universal stress protein E
MQTIKRILVDIDPDKNNQPALTRAIQLVATSNATIKLLSCVYYPSVVASNFLSPHQLEKAKAAIQRMNETKMAKLIAQNSAANITYETEVIWHSPIYQGIMQVVEKFKPDLVIKATHPHRTGARRLITPTDWQLLKSCPQPILFVKHSEWPKNATVIAALDPDHNLSKSSELDKRILQSAHIVSKQLNAALHAFHCFDPNYWDILFEAVGVSGMWADVFSGNPEKDESLVINNLRYEQNQKFADACSELVPNSANQHLISGNIETSLPQTLQKLHAGILVLGTTYRTGLLGSTAEKLLETVECDVLGVKPKDFEFFV